jgi:hypothetical protein
MFKSNKFNLHTFKEPELIMFKSNKFNLHNFQRTWTYVQEFSFTVLILAINFRIWILCQFHLKRSPTWVQVTRWIWTLIPLFEAPHWRTCQCWYILYTWHWNWYKAAASVLAASVDTWYQYWYQEQASLYKATQCTTFSIRSPVLLNNLKRLENS